MYTGRQRWGSVQRKCLAPKKEKGARLAVKLRTERKPVQLVALGNGKYIENGKQCIEKNGVGFLFVFSLPLSLDSW